MSLDDVIITCFYWSEEMLPILVNGYLLRARGIWPKLSDSQVLAIEVGGSSLGLSQDQVLFDCFVRHSAHFFPTLIKGHKCFPP